MLTEANLDIEFFPYALYHAIQLSNYFPEPNTITSTIDKSTSKRDNLYFLQTFVCSFYVRPLGNRKLKFKNHVSKVILLGYYPHNTRNVLCNDVHTHRIKLAPHVRFDEGMNELPMPDTPLNVQHIQRVDNGQPLT